jgi:agmatine deiminase
MITDAQTNFVYFSKHLKVKHENFYRELSGILKKHDLEHDVLCGTKDIWCRDYMPIQVDKDKFVEYRYDPDYLQAQKWRSIKTYPDIVCDLLELKTIKSDLILDGGNIIKSDDAVVLTDKIFKENKANYKPSEVIFILKKLFEVRQIVIIPWDKEHEEYGHADGMIRFIGNKKVLLNGYFKEYDSHFKQALYGSLDSAGLKHEELVYDIPKPDENRNWAYINFLQTRDLLLIPSFGISEDELALQQFKQYFPDYAAKGKIEQIDTSEIIKGGGGLNCISWNILKF